MRKSKLVVEKDAGVTKEALGDKTYVFTKNKGLHLPCDLGDQGVIKFSVRQYDDGKKTDFGTFVTTDKKVANALRAYAEENPHACIFEKQ